MWQKLWKKKLKFALTLYVRVVGIYVLKRKYPRPSGFGAFHISQFLVLWLSFRWPRTVNMSLFFITTLFPVTPDFTTNKNMYKFSCIRSIIDFFIQLLFLVSPLLLHCLPKNNVLYKIAFRNYGKGVKDLQVIHWEILHLTYWVFYNRYTEERRI